MKAGRIRFSIFYDFLLSKALSCGLKLAMFESGYTKLVKRSGVRWPLNIAKRS